MKIDILESFPTYVGFQEMQLDLDDLRKSCYEMRNKDVKGRTLSNSGGAWQSKDMNMSSPDARYFKNLIKAINIELNNFGKEFGLQEQICVANFWININPKGGHNKAHVHCSSLFSGVFYIDTPKDSGSLEILNPNRLMVETYKVIHQNIRFIPEIKASENGRYLPPKTLYPGSLNVNCKPNLLVIFPAWIEHLVNTNNSDSDRISISFNSQLVPRNF